jgi:hypothetical protein
MSTVTITLLSSRKPKLRSGERALVLPAVRRQPGLRRWRTFDSVNGSANGANGHGAAQVRSLSIKDLANPIIAELADANVVLMGPLVLAAPGTNVPSFYAAICSADHSGYFSLILGSDSLDDAVEARRLVCNRLIERGLVVREFKDELTLAKECALLWPSETTRNIERLVRAGR